MAGVAENCNMFPNVSKVVLCDRRNTSAKFSEDDLHVYHASWQAQQEAQHFRPVALRVFVNRIVRAASSGDNVQTAWQAWRFATCDEN